MPASALDDYLAGFGEEPGYLDFAAFGPLSAVVQAEAAAQQDAMSRARFGAVERLLPNGDRLRAAAAALTGFREDQIAQQPSATDGLAQAIFGVTGGVLLSRADDLRLTTAAVRASEALSATAPIWLDTEGGRVTPGVVRDQLTSTTAAVAVSAVDARTGHVADLEGIREVIGDRVLIVDAVQALGAVDLPWTVADALACGGSTWLRAGWGGAFLALSDRAVHRLTPALSGAGASAEPAGGEVPPPSDGAAAFRLGEGDPAAAGRLAAALDELHEAGSEAVARAVAAKVERVLALADEAGLPVVSPRAAAERAGIVVLAPAPDRLTPLAAALVNHGVSATIRQGRVRLSPHAGTTADTIDLLRTALVAFASATRHVGR